jgi:hypothetical protein
MLHCNDPGSQMTIRVHIRNPMAKEMEVLARITYLFKALPESNSLSFKQCLHFYLPLAKSYLRIRKLKSCDRKHDLCSCNQGILG